ncbi:hypothetical protein TCAL_10871, partial [Tigriopus californicus]
MPLFGGASPFEADIEKITNEKNTSEDWGLIMDLCDRISAAPNGAKEGLKVIVKRLNHQDPHVVLQAITLLDACVNNCGRNFCLEVASREFEKSFVALLRKSQRSVQEKLKALLKKWAHGEFKGDPAFSLIPALYHQLKHEGIDFHSDQPKKAPVSKDPNVVNTQQEQDDIAAAIELSLKETKSNPSEKRNFDQTNNGSGLYPATNLAAVEPAKDLSFNEPQKARALYDFEAAEDNELTFKTGEIVIILDDSDVNWWKGSNHRGEGLFPANFVSKDLEPKEDSTKARRRSVQFNDEVEVKTVETPPVPLVTEIDESKLQRVLDMLHSADPTSDANDPLELAAQEEQANMMGPLVDNELEVVDRRYAQLTQLSTQLVEAMNLYHQLMRDIPASSHPSMHAMPNMNGTPQYYPAYSSAPTTSMYGMPPPSGGFRSIAPPPPGVMGHPPGAPGASGPSDYNPVIYGNPMSHTLPHPTSMASHPSNPMHQ